MCQRSLIMNFLMIIMICLKVIEGWTSGFVKTANSEFTLNGRPFYLVGSNNYYLHYADQNSISNVFQTAQTAGVNVMRMWGFLETKAGNAIFQYKDSNGNIVIDSSSANGLVHLDNTIACAKNYNIRLIIVLSNNWDDMGGVGVYNSWVGNNYHDEFFTNQNSINLYQNYVKAVVTRTNSVNGVAYAQDDTILAWELMNEVRNIGSNQGTSPSFQKSSILQWVENQSAFIKSLDSNHLVAVGDEGFFSWPGQSDYTYNGSQGTDFDGFIWSNNIDFGTFHLYPETFGSYDDQWSQTFILNHLKQAQKAGKPALMEEYGWKEASQRAYYYREWENLICSFGAGGGGSLNWMLAGWYDGSWYAYDDGFIYFADGSQYNTDVLNNMASYAQKAKSGGCLGGASTAIHPISNPMSPKGTNVYGKNSVSSHRQKIISELKEQVQKTSDLVQSLLDQL